jgi:hypothetical protein
VDSLGFGGPRAGVSELYAAMLLVGVTLSLGSLIVAAATSQFSLASGAATLGEKISQEEASVQLTLVYSTTTMGTCGSYRGSPEGTSVSLALFDYGSGSFTPSGFIVNSTIVAGAYGAVSPGELTQYFIPLGACAHSSGQTVVAFDAAGDEVQFET